MKSQLVCTRESSEIDVNTGIFWRRGGCPSTLVVDVYILYAHVREANANIRLFASEGGLTDFSLKLH